MTCRIAAAFTRKWGGSARAESIDRRALGDVGEVDDQRLAAGLADRIEAAVVDVDRRSTRAPSRSSCSATACPMPLPAPVTIARRPSKLIGWVPRWGRSPRAG